MTYKDKQIIFDLSYKLGMVALGLILLTVVAVCLFTSCSEKVITVPEIHEYYHSKTDTVRQNDSTIIEKYTTIMQLDSDAMAAFGIQLKDAERAWLVQSRELEKRIKELSERKTDTIIKVDSVAVPYPVEKKLTKWQQIKIDIGGWLVGAVVLVILVFCVFLARRIVMNKFKS